MYQYTLIEQIFRLLMAILLLTVSCWQIRKLFIRKKLRHLSFALFFLWLVLVEYNVPYISSFRVANVVIYFQCYLNIYIYTTNFIKTKNTGDAIFLVGWLFIIFFFWLSNHGMYKLEALLIKINWN